MASPEAKSKAWEEGCGGFRGLDVEVSFLVLVRAQEWGLRLDQGVGSRPDTGLQSWPGKQHSPFSPKTCTPSRARSPERTR